jgi:hypothetical protein
MFLSTQQSGVLLPKVRFALRGVRMSRRVVLDFALSLQLLIASAVVAQNPPSSDPQAVAFAAQSTQALTGGTSIRDVTLTGNVTWTAGSDTEAGTATLLAFGAGESRMDLALSGGTRTEIRDASTGIPQGEWFAPGDASGLFASQNCWTDAVWFFPVLGSLAAGPNIILAYIGQENRNGETVQHIRTYVYQPVAYPASPTPEQLSTMDFYLDAVTLLPLTVTYNAHPDNDATTNISVEIDFSNYQPISGVNVPMRIQKYIQGTLTIELMLSSAAFNTGLPITNFTIS